MTPTAPFRLGDRLVEPATNRLHPPDGDPVQLEPKVMAVLLRLVRDAGEVVTRDQLLDAVWPGLYVTEHVVFRCISDLRASLGDDPARPRYVETIRKRGYRLIAPLGEARPAPRPALSPVADAPPATPRAHRRGRAPAAAAAVAAVAVLAAFAWLRAAASGPSPSPRTIPLTSFPGSELDPALSPDGETVAFAWDGRQGDNFDIYLKPIGGETPRRLTSHPAEDKNPAWSPDGARLAFVRAAPAGDGGVHVVSAEGGGEQRVATTSSGEAPDLAWSPDGRFLYFADRGSAAGPTAIERLELATGERMTVTRPSGHLHGDRDLALSADGRRLAFARAVAAGVEDVWVTDSAGGEARRLTLDRTSINGLEWAPDGTAILFSSARDGFSRLWTIEAQGGRPALLSELGDGAYDPTFARGRIAFERKLYDTNVWRLELGGDGGPRLRTAVGSTRWDASPSVSPDGQRIAFTSDRSGSAALWITASDGEGPVVRLATDRPVISPVAWSPAGDSLVVALRDGDHSHLFRTTPAAGPPKQVTSGRGNDVAPSFSRDGRWIYFGSDRGGAWQIWKLPADGGRATRVTKAGGERAIESADGATLFVSRPDRGGLWALPAAGGVGRMVLSSSRMAPRAAWAVGREAIYFISPANDSAAKTAIERFDLTSGEITRISPPLAGLHVSGLGLALAPDESFLLFGRVDRGDGDLVLVEGAAWPGRR